MNKNLTNSKDLTVAVDIGTTKVCAVAAVRNDYGKLEIIGYSTVFSDGVHKGIVKNIDRTVSAISQVIKNVEEQIGRKITKVNVSLSGQHVRSYHQQAIIPRQNPNIVISDTDVDSLINQMGNVALPAGDKIIEILPQEFSVDNEGGILDPRGMTGVRLEANFHLITSQHSTQQNLNRCIEMAGLTIGKTMLEPMASAEAVLTDEEKGAGIALVDIGGGTTDIAIFKDGLLRHTAIIPLGGNNITNDIKEGCEVLQPQAEKLKVRFGCALAQEINENRIITVQGIRGHEPRAVSEINLARIIQSRMEEILDFVGSEIRRTGYERKLIGGIVITGGGALLNHIRNLAAYRLGMSVRIGSPRESLAQGYHEEISSPMYATAIGLLLKGVPDMTPVANEVMVEDLQPDTSDTDAQNTIPYHEPDEAGDTDIFKDPKNWFDNWVDRATSWFTETKD